MNQGYPGSTWAVLREHVHVEVVELADEVELDKIDSREILSLLSKVIITDADLQEWVDSNSRRLFKCASQLDEALHTVVEYCETHEHAARGAKQRMRLVTKTLLEAENPQDTLSILILLAAHGGVCNVQKEVGVNSAYGLLTRTFALGVESQSFHSCVNRNLQELRDTITEDLFLEMCSEGFIKKDTHPLVAFRNALADRIGLKTICDDILPNLPADVIIRYEPEFWERYNCDAITDFISNAINHQPRRIPFDTTMNFVTATSVVRDTYFYRENAFDMVSGNLKMRYVQHCLREVGILSGPAPPLEPLLPQVPAPQSTEQNTEVPAILDLQRGVTTGTACAYGLVRDRAPSYLAHQSANSSTLSDASVPRVRTDPGQATGLMETAPLSMSEHIAKEQQRLAERLKTGWLFLRADKVVEQFERLRPWQSSYNRLNQRTRSTPAERYDSSRISRW